MLYKDNKMTYELAELGQYVEAKDYRTGVYAFQYELNGMTCFKIGKADGLKGLYDRLRDYRTLLPCYTEVLFIEVPMTGLSFKPQDLERGLLVDDGWREAGYTRQGFERYNNGTRAAKKEVLQRVGSHDAMYTFQTMISDSLCLK